MLYFVRIITTFVSRLSIVQTTCWLAARYPGCSKLACKWSAGASSRDSVYDCSVDIVRRWSWNAPCGIEAKKTGLSPMATFWNQEYPSLLLLRGFAKLSFPPIQIHP